MTSTEPLLAAGYTRQSKGKERSIEEQEAAIREACAGYGWQVSRAALLRYCLSFPVRTHRTRRLDPPARRSRRPRLRGAGHLGAIPR